MSQLISLQTLRLVSHVRIDIVLKLQRRWLPSAYIGGGREAIQEFQMPALIDEAVSDGKNKRAGVIRLLFGS